MAKTETSDNRELWYTIFAVGHPALRSFQRFHKRLPSAPRCKMCYAPFRGIGGALMRLKGKGPSNRNPRFCSACDGFMRSNPGGAEVEVSMVFADVRGSATLAERMTPTAFGEAMRGFYDSATRVLNACDGFLIDLVGDEVVALFPPGFSGADHASKAVRAAQELLKVEVPAARDGSVIRVGMGIHTGVVFIGTMTGAAAGIEDVRALGDNVNVTARLASLAQPNEALVSEEACAAAGLDTTALESRSLTLKGRTAPMAVRVLSRVEGRA